MTAKAMPTIRCQDGGSRKNKMPATAMIAAPPARMAGNGRQRTASLKKQEERDRAGADANAGEQRVIETSSTEFLIPSSGKPENRQIDQDRQCGAGFDNETAETFANAIGSETCKDLVRAVKNSGNDRIPEPGCHEQESSL